HFGCLNIAGYSLVDLLDGITHHPFNQFFCLCVGLKFFFGDFLVRLVHHYHKRAAVRSLQSDSDLLIGVAFRQPLNPPTGRVMEELSFLGIRKFFNLGLRKGRGSPAVQGAATSAKTTIAMRFLFTANRSVS